MAEKRGKHVWSTPKCGISFVDKHLANIERQINYKFIVVRNPYERLISFYKNKIVWMGNEFDFDITKDINKVMKTPHYEIVNTDVSFQTFIHSLQGRNVNDLERHLRKQTRTVENITFDKIVKLENFKQDMKSVCETLEIDYSIITDSKRENSFEGTSKINEPLYDKPSIWFRQNGFPKNSELFYSQELKDIVYQLYKDDFQKFGYQK